MTGDTPRTEGRNSHSKEELLEALCDHAVSLDTTDPDTRFDDLAPLRETFEDVRIVGLGEATHGTREFFRIKDRLIRFLVSELDCRLVALEANLPETLAINDYVVHGEGDPKEALEGIYFWTWNVESVLAMIEWLREFNRSRPPEDRVRFHGVDAQYTQGAVDELLAFFETVDPDFLESIRADLKVADDDGVAPVRADDLDARLAATERVVPDLRDRLAEHRDRYAAETSTRTWERARRHVRVLEQVVEFGRAWQDREAIDDGADGEREAVERCLRARDSAMADNVDWLLEHENADRVAVWAHDAHLNRVEQTSRDTGASAPSMGSLLADRHGENYYALGFAFGRGSFQAIGEDPDADGDESGSALREWTIDSPRPGTIDATLDDLGYSRCVLDLRGASEDRRAAEWLARPQDHVSLGAVYDPENPGKYVTEYAYADAFDAVCYVAETTRARPIE